MPNGDKWDNLMATQFRMLTGQEYGQARLCLLTSDCSKGCPGNGTSAICIMIGREAFFSFCLHFAHAFTLCRGEVKGDREVSFSEIPF